MAKVEVYMRDYCGYCSAALRLLSDKKAEVEIYNIWKDPARKVEMLERAKGRSTVPQIFIDNQHIGGCDDLFALERAGNLDAKLRA